MAPKKPAKVEPAPSSVSTASTKAYSTTSSAAGKPTKAENKPAAQPTSSSNTTTSSSSSTPSLKNAQDAQQIAIGVWNNYVDKTPQRTKLMDTFMLFLMAVGILQFVYCVIAGNYVRLKPIYAFYRSEVKRLTRLLQPFNAFLSGFSATVGQFVLTASLRMQTNSENKADFKSLSDERSVPAHLSNHVRLADIPDRAFADFVFGSLILHFFCVNFIN